MNKIYIVHCWDGTKDDGWYPWIDKELSNKNNTVFRFNMPNTGAPVIEDWVSFLDKQIESIDENTFFIGHSIGCQTILRYLESKEVTTIGGILLVASWLDLLDYAISDEESKKIADPWLKTPINFDKIKYFTNNIQCIFSDNDYFVSLDQKDKFKKLLNSKTIVVNNKGHISQDDEVYELKEIKDAAIEMINNKI